MMRKTSTGRLSVLFILLMASITASGQSPANSDNFAKMVDFLPPPPNAAAMIKHAAITVNKNTGSPGVNIPFYTLKGNKLAVQVSLGYSSTGLKVDELAGRTGMGFSLTAGGVITRTMRGLPDELNTRSMPPGTLGDNCGSYNYMNQVVESAQLPGMAGGLDSEPDLYSFSMNGASGSFVFDNAMQPVLIPADKAKVEYSFTSGAPWNFKITTTDGIAYYFGGDGAVEKTKRESSCARSYTSYIANAWYLTKIEHPNGETINFTYTPHTYSYDNGVSETMHYRTGWAIDAGIFSNENCNVVCAASECPAAPPPSRCINKTKTQGVLLNTIFNSNGTLQFFYTTRSDCEDKLINEIKYFAEGNFAGSFSLYYSHRQSDMSYANETSAGHNYTPYLTDIIEYASDQQQSRNHHFEYNDAGARPPRLSFSQDHWGYFNGKHNSSFIPRPATSAARANFPDATANREPDGFFAAKGMLSKIVYPTGGMDSIIYEPNQVRSDLAVYKPYHEFVCSVTGTSFSTTVTRTNYFSIDNPQEVEIRISCIDNTGNGNVTQQNTGTLQVKTNTGTLLFQETFWPGNNYTRFIKNNGSPLSPGTYTLVFTASGSAVTTSITVKHYPSSVNNPEKNTVVGGVRVKSVMTANPYEKGMIKRYYYGSLDSLDVSSLSDVAWPVYTKDYKKTYPSCQLNCSNQTSAIQAFCTLTAMYSGSLNNLFSYQSSPISYKTVVESMGENFEGGGVQVKFNTRADARGYAIWGNDMIESPLSNFSTMLNGKPMEELVFKKAASGAVVPLKKTEYNYIVDTRNSRILYGCNINKKYDIVEMVPVSTCPPTTPVSPTITGAFDVVKYDIMSYWTHIDTETQTVYDENGLNPVVTNVKTYFDNQLNQQPTRTESTSSEGELTLTAMKYPHDFETTAPYDAMIARNMITVPVEVETTTDAQPVSKIRTNYTHAGNNNYVPASVEKSLKGGAMESEGTIDLYDAQGNILQYTSRAGIPTAILWGHNYRYPAAQVIGAAYSQAVSQLTVTVAALQNLTGSALAAQVNNIRTGLPQARVTSYTYSLPAGVSSITDANNKTNSFEYDAFFRLLQVKDQDGNTVKKNNYSYAGATLTAKLALYFNQAMSQVFTCQTCVSGYQAGAGLTYTVPAGKHFSFLSQADADAKAQADMNANGQLHANKNGFCTNDICAGEGYKLVNCLCEAGLLTPVSCTDNPDGSWNQVYKYVWSDGSSSSNYTRVMAACTGVDKKKIGCACVQGVKVYTDGWQNANGTWTCVYHWRWPDNTTSSNYSEISAAPCIIFEN